MSAPVTRLNRKLIDWLGTHKCNHNHTYLEHWSCYERERPANTMERIGYLDIETSNLAANYGIMLAYCIKERGKGKIHHGVISEADLKGDLDKNLVIQCIEDMKKFDRVITYYGTKFDIPFIRTRAAMHDVPFMDFGEMLHTDIYYWVRNKFRLNSNRLIVACESLLGKTNKTRLDSNQWIRALQGNKKALAYVLTHCKYDVIDLERLHNKIQRVRKITDVSI